MGYSRGFVGCRRSIYYPGCPYGPRRVYRRGGLCGGGVRPIPPRPYPPRYYR